jgi:uncharacterized membrane protein YcaP (DUF421 family)
MEEIAGILFRLTFAYLYLLALTRLSGKRTVGEVTPFDFAVTLSGERLQPVFELERDPWTGLWQITSFDELRGLP